jgi:hypothetical protein
LLASKKAWYALGSLLLAALALVENGLTGTDIWRGVITIILTVVMGLMALIYRDYLRRMKNLEDENRKMRDNIDTLERNAQTHDKWAGTVYEEMQRRMKSIDERLDRLEQKHRR